MTRYGRRMLTVLTLLIALAALPLLAAACGSGDDNAAGGGGETASASASPMPVATTTSTDDIIARLQQAGNFTTLLTAIKAAGLEEVLAGAGPYTLFAPNDEAFAKLDPKALDKLMADPSGALADTLAYHLVTGTVMAADLKDGMELETAMGDSMLTVKVDGDTVMVNGAKVIQADITASNGVVHVIDTVLIPPKQ